MRQKFANVSRPTFYNQAREDKIETTHFELTIFLNAFQVKQPVGALSETLAGTSTAETRGLVP